MSTPADLVGVPSSWCPSLTGAADRVAFISDRSGLPQLWVTDLDGGSAARHLPLSADPVVAVDWSPDGSWLACAVATGGGVRTQVWVVRPDGTDAQCLAGADGRHAKLGPWLRDGHRLVVGRPPEEAGEESRSVVIDPDAGTEELLASGGLLDVLDVSGDDRLALLRDGPRGAQFCVVVDRHDDVDRPLLSHPEVGSTSRAILRPAPEGPGWVAYLVSDAGRPRTELLAVPVDPSGRRLSGGRPSDSPGDDRAPSAATVAARDDADLEWLDADDAGRLLILGWNVGGRSEIELVDAVTWERRPVPALPGLVVSGLVMARVGDRTVLCVEGPDLPPGLVAVDHGTGTVTPVAAAHRGPVSGLVRPTVEAFESHDGLPLTGWLYRPPGATGPGPVVLSFHGGPEAQERPAFHPEHQALVAAGLSVFAPNIRGSSGFGRAFVHADDRHGRHDAISDVDACAAHLVAAGVAAPGHIAVSGRSYGGYLTLAALVAFPDMFAAGVDICGMSDLLTFYEHTEPWIGAAAVSKYGDPVRDRALLEDLSPLRRAERIAAPLLVVHGELDTNVPIGEAHQIVAALREMDRPVEYLELAGEGHEYRAVASRRRLVARLVEFLVPLLT